MYFRNFYSSTVDSCEGFYGIDFLKIKIRKKRLKKEKNGYKKDVVLIKKNNLISKGIISRAHLIVLLMILMSSFMSCGRLTNDDGGANIDEIDINVIEGRVVDGPIRGATVFLDINKNGKMDNNEPNQMSDGDGYFRFEADVPIGTVVISRGGVDTVTG